MKRKYLCTSELDRKLDEFAQDFKGEVASAEVRRGNSRKQTIQASGMSESAFYTAWRHPEKFRIEQCIRIMLFLKIPMPERWFS